ncbi:hypothetical protein LY13_001217 [Prauserella aidingensis]|nr:hypothetical protein [Prauserella aidingensis]
MRTHREGRGDHFDVDIGHCTGKARLASATVQGVQRYYWFTWPARSGPVGVNLR